MKSKRKILKNGDEKKKKRKHHKIPIVLCQFSDHFVVGRLDAADADDLGIVVDAADGEKRQRRMWVDSLCVFSTF